MNFTVLLLANLVLVVFWFKGTPTVKQPQQYSNALFPITEPIEIGPQWPFLPDNEVFAKAWLHGDATISIDGSSEALDLQNNSAVDPQTAVNILLQRGASARIQTSGTGYIYFTGPSTVTASWSIVTPKGTILKQTKQLSKNYVSIKATAVSGTIDLVASTSATLKLSASDLVFPVQMWSDEYSKPSYGSYVMQAFLGTQWAFNLNIVRGLNDTFQVWKTADPGTKVTITLDAYAVAQTPDSFETLINDAIGDANLGGPITLQAFLTSYDSENPSFRHVGILAWQSTGTLYSIGLVSPTDYAMAATLGLYEQTASGCVVVPSLDAPFAISYPESYSPGAVVTQWPAVYTLRNFRNPGSHAADGYVRIADLDTTSVLVLAASAREYTFTTSLDNPVYGATNVRVDAWAAGGGDFGSFYGGAASHVSMVLSVTGGIQTISANVGTQGRRISDVASSGGGFTKVTINGLSLMILGGGGGASKYSHGGQGGGPLATDVSFTGTGVNGVIQYAGLSGSSVLFDEKYYAASGPQYTAPINNIQALGPEGKPKPLGTVLDFEGQTIQGSGAGADGTKGSDGYFYNGTEIYGSNGGQGGTGYGGGNPFSILAKGGTGMIPKNASNIVGAGGGGATALLAAGTYATLSLTPGSIEIVSIEMVGPWLSDSNEVLGGGNPQNTYVKTAPNKGFATAEYFSDGVSLLSQALDAESVAYERHFVTAFLQKLASKIAIDGTLAVPSTSQNMFWPLDTFFVNPETISGPIESYVPIGPHDDQMPNTNGPNVRPIAYSNNILSIYNDGQIDPEQAPLYLETSFSGLGVPADTLVTGIRFGSNADGNQCIFLTLSETITNAAGPFVWALHPEGSYHGGPSGPDTANDVPDDPAIFRNGTLIHSAGLKTPKNHFWDTTYLLSEIDPILEIELVSKIYEQMPQFYIQTNQTSQVIDTTGFYTLPGAYSGPNTANSGPPPDYLQKIWPVGSNPQVSENVLSFVSSIYMRVYIRPMHSTQSFGTRKSVHTFTSTGTFTVPPFAQKVNVWAYGGGGSSKSENTKGASGSCCIGTLNLAGKTVQIIVGQPSNSGGSLSGMYLNTQPLLIAAGGGCGGTLTDGVPELGLTRRPNDGIVGANTTSAGQVGDSTSGSGGSGFRGGSVGLKGHGGGSGRSLVPPNGQILGDLRQKYYTAGIGQGTSLEPGNTANPGGPGLVVIEVIY